GAFTRGIINLIKGEQLYIYVGGMGHGVNGGYNGGGYGAVQSSTGSGGGATDIRAVGGNWNDIPSLRSRIMVAAGGGGSATAAVGGAIGGFGGWLVAPELATSTTPLQGRGGTQTSGGIFGPNASHPLNATSGGFGSGGTAGFYEAGAGGGGYYGGGGGTHQTPNKSGSGGGGSSYISGHPGVNSINSSGIHTNSLIHWSGKSFKETLMLSGASMNTGAYANENGRARIVLLR
ncbi:MAG: glycine-rich protein, partial [Bacilli bacterium]